MSKKKESNKKESQDKKSQDDKSQDPESQDKKSQDDKTQDPESQKTEKTEESMSRTVTVKKDDDAPENIFNLGESIKPGQKYHLDKGGDGLHFKNLESVKRYFERRFKGHDVKID